MAASLDNKEITRCGGKVRYDVNNDDIISYATFTATEPGGKCYDCSWKKICPDCGKPGKKQLQGMTPDLYIQLANMIESQIRQAVDVKEEKLMKILSLPAKTSDPDFEYALADARKAQARLNDLRALLQKFEQEIADPT